MSQLRALIERIERLDEEIRAMNADKSDIYKEAKALGFDAAVMRKVVAARRKSAAERDEADALFDLYWSEVHGAPSRVHAHEASPVPSTSQEEAAA